MTGTSGFRGLFCSAAFVALSVFSPMLVAQGSGRETLETASANIFANHPDGCLLVNVAATQAKRQRQPSATKYLTVSLFRDSAGVDCASGPALQLVASGQTDQFDFSLNQRLTEAALSASMPMTFDGTGATIAFVLNVRWTGVAGRLYPERQRPFVLEPNAASGTSIAHVHGYSRAATLSATISDGTIDYVANLFMSEGNLTASTIFTSGPQPRSFR